MPNAPAPEHVFVFDLPHLGFLAAFLLLTFLINLFVTKRSQLDLLVEKSPTIGGVLKIMRGLGIDPWIIAQGICLIVKGRLPEYVTQDAAEIERLIKPKSLRNPPVLPLIMWALVFGAILILCGACREIIGPAKSVDSVARQLCALYFGERKSLSVEDAAAAFCATEKQLSPWLQQVTAAKRKAGMAAEQRAEEPLVNPYDLPDGGEAGAQ